MKTNIALEIKKLREKLQLSQHRFGKKIGVAGKTVCAYEHARAMPSLKVYDKISEVYGVTLSDATNKRNCQIKEMLEKITKELETLYTLTDA